MLADASGKDVHATPTIFLWSDDDDARRIVTELAAALEFEITILDSCHALDRAALHGQYGCLVFSWRADDAAHWEPEAPLPRIALARDASVRQAVEAMRQGLVDFHVWPIDVDVLRKSLVRAMAASASTLALQRERLTFQRRLASLTEREREVMELAAKGRSTPAIAAELGISPKTAEHHRTRLLKKMQVANVTQLMMVLLKHRDLDPRDS